MKSSLFCPANHRLMTFYQATQNPDMEGTSLLHVAAQIFT